MNPLRHLLFILRQRRAGNRVSFSAYLKGYEWIEMDHGCKICVETHPDVLGDRILSEMFAGLVAKGFSLDFSLIRKNVFFFHRAP